MPITFEKLHEKLLNFEASVLTTKPDPLYFLATANLTRKNLAPWRSPAPSNTTNHSWHPSTNLQNKYPTPPNISQLPTQAHRPSRPYLGYCQICRLQGHIAKRCPSFRLVPINTSNSNTSSPSPALPNHSATPWQPRAHYASNTPSTTS